MFKIKNQEIIEDIVGGIADFPKYTTQLINLANQNVGGTRPKVVGQMSELIQEFPGSCYQDWVDWYQEKNPDAIEDATTKVFIMLEKMKSAMVLIDEEMVKKWIKDLVLTKHIQD